MNWRRSFVAVTTLALCPSQVLATGISVVIFDEFTGETGNNFSQTVGWQFNLMQEITVTALQWFDDFGNGLTISHEVGIWDPHGNLLSSVVVPAGAEAPLEDGMWRTIKITELVLPAADGYIVGGYNGHNAVDRVAFDVQQTMHPSISLVDATFSDANGLFECPTNFAGAAENGIYGPSFQVIPPGCTWDFNGDELVGAGDLITLLGAWGKNPGHPADFDGDGNVGTADLIELLGNWGPCPK